MTDRVRPTKLKFKGEKSKKKRKHDGDEDGEHSSRRRRRDGSDEPSDSTWVMPENPLELRGPTFIYHPSDPSPLCITFDSTRGRIVLASLDKHSKPEDDDEPGPSTSLLDKTPTDVSQVWVTTRVAGSSTINFRSGASDGKFLSCDQHGLVSAYRDARGPQEEWTPVILSDGMVSFMNVYEKYLSVDEVAGGTMQLRGDSEEVGFNERFYVKIQGKYKREAHEEERKKKEGTQKTKIDEASTK
jgi:protein FRG1